MGRGLIEKIGWELDDLEGYATELRDEESKKDMEYRVENIRGFLNEIKSEIDDANRCLKNIN